MIEANAPTDVPEEPVGASPSGEAVLEEDTAESEPTEGGEVKGLRDLTFEPAKHRAQTARTLAYLLVITLASSIVLQYVSVLYLVCLGKPEALENVSKIFNSWLPVISGLVSGAATYYFTKDRD
jgi:hypothetical protein